MPIDYKKYHPEWKTRIRPDILKRANNCCEECGVANGAYGYRAANGDFYDWQYIEDALEKHGDDLFDNVLSNCFTKQGEVTKGIKIVLTISHTDHDITNNDYSNLKALCQLHHNRHDAAYRAANRNKKPSLFNNF